MNSNNKLISVKGRERPLSKKQKQVFLSLSKHEFNFSLLRDTDYSKKNKIFLEIGFGSGEIIFKEARKNLNNIYIGIEYYRRGVAQLLKKIEEDTNCLKEIYLEVSKNNLEGISFYKKMGFKKISTRKDYFIIRNKRVDAFLMSKILNND